MSNEIFMEDSVFHLIIIDCDNILWIISMDR